MFNRTRAERRLMVALDHPSIAANFPASEVEALLRKGAKANTILPPDGSSFLALTAIWGNVGAASVLLAHGADPNGNALRRYVPLHIAASNVHVDLVKLLLASGADINARDRDGRTALFPTLTHAKSNRSEIPQLLLGSGINPEIRNNQGMSALDEYEHQALTLSRGPYSDGQELADLDRIRSLLTA